MVGVAQLVRASGCGPEGRGFESHHSPHKETEESHRDSSVSLWGDRIVSRFEPTTSCYATRSACAEYAYQVSQAFTRTHGFRIPSFTSRIAIPLFLYGVNESLHDSNPLRVAMQLVQRARSTHIKFRRHLRARMGSESRSIHLFEMIPYRNKLRISCTSSASEY